MSNKLSVVISAYNEERRIKNCLESVKFADEIIFIDNSSTDATVDVAKKYTKKIFTQPNNLMLNVNKNYGFTKATGDWILYLDADEIVSDELQKEVQKVISGKDDFNGYWIPRKNFIFKKLIMHGGWYPDHQMRLFKKGQGKFEERHVHEMINVNGKTEYLKEHLLHDNYESISQFLHKTTIIYAPNEADELIRKGYVFDFRDCFKFPSKEFISRFFARNGYQDGFHGLILAMFMSFYHFIVFCFLWERNGFKDTQANKIVNFVEKESLEIKKELNYWIIKEKIKLIKNPVKKLIVKIASFFSS